MTGASATAVVDRYQQRSAYARAELDVRAPELLHDLLRTVRHVAEVPSGCGHFLAAYHANQVHVTLVDASSHMIDQARAHARGLGLAPGALTTHVAFLHDLRLANTVDLVVVPNAALNQLACQMPLPRLWQRLAAAVPAGTRVLAQLCCAGPDGLSDTSTFYDPRRPHRRWFVDRRLDPAHACGAVVRLRRQRRIGDRLHIDFAYYDAQRRRLHETAAELQVLDQPAVRSAAANAGFAAPLFVAGGPDRLSELLVTRTGPGLAAP